MQTGELRRRDFMRSGMAACGPRAAPAMPVIGYLNRGTSVGCAPFAVAFRRGLNDVSCIEGQNVVIEYRWAQGQYDRLPALAASTPRSAGCQGGDLSYSDRIYSRNRSSRVGLVGSLSRPNGNLTGVNNYLSVLGAKRVEFLRQLVPTAVALGMLVNPTYPDADQQANDVAKAASVSDNECTS
jgi:hypothetical protein